LERLLSNCSLASRSQKIALRAWRSLGILRRDSWSFSDPVAAEEKGRAITADDVRRKFHIYNNWRDLVDVIEIYQKIGANEVCLYTSCDKESIRTVAENVLSVS
jgi:hypothetical protein